MCELFLGFLLVTTYGEEKCKVFLEGAGEGLKITILFYLG